MRLSPLAAVAAACVLTLTACGDDGEDPKPSDAKDSPSAPTELPSDFPTDFAPDGTDKQDLPDAAGLADKVCEALDPADVGDLVGGDVEANVIPGTGCIFQGTNAKDLRSVSLTFAAVATLGGAEGFKASLGALGGGKGLDEVPDVGDGAFVVAIDGPTGASASAGLLAGDIAIQLLVTPGKDAAADAAKAASVELLKLVDAAL